jgi:large subunit ribosomal protein L6
MIEGVTNGYKKSLEIQGVGYKAEMSGKNLVLSGRVREHGERSGPGNVTVQLEGANKVHVSGADKQAVGEFAARVRRSASPSPYKGKGSATTAKWSRSRPARRSLERVPAK